MNIFQIFQIFIFSVKYGETKYLNDEATSSACFQQNDAKHKTQKVFASWVHLLADDYVDDDDYEYHGK